MTVHTLLRRTAARFVPRVASPIQYLVCKRTQGTTRRLVSGPACYVCSACLAQPLQTATPPTNTRHSVRCDWCRAPRLLTQLYMLGQTAVCTACLEYMRAITTDAG